MNASSPAPRGGKYAVPAWCLYDAANSAFGTVIVTFVYSLFFARVVAGDETQGNVLWNYMMGVSGLFLAVLSPVLGAAADHYGARKRFVFVFTALCAAATALLWFGAPGRVWFVLAAACVGNLGFELSLVFYNAMLPHIAKPGAMGRLSGIAWGTGYLGGLGCLAAVLLFLTGIGGVGPLIPLPQDGHEHIRAAALLTALWIAVLSVPLFLFTQDDGRTGLGFAQSVRAGLGQLLETLRGIRAHGSLARFLIASALYRDGLNTLFSAGAIYAGSALGLDFRQVLLFGIGINVTAGIGAAAFGFLDDRIGPKKTAMISLAGLAVSAAAVLATADKALFIALSMFMGIFIGPAQSASRTLAARLAPPGKTAQIFGLYAFTGRAVAFLGPFCFAAATDLFDSQRAGMSTIILFWLAGMALLAKVREP